MKMVGWSWTWDPTAPTPTALLSDHMRAAATSRLVHQLKPASDNLAEV